jgi:hypothetical protein
VVATSDDVTVDPPGVLVTTDVVTDSEPVGGGVVM